ncbi:MAG: H+-translocating transhydrogenase subunit alpha [Miltoncostaeaceae bacterium]|nr:H+-translocating transhydrogenase subunit alpha [Miltoncostaeaceae bacterium]
MTPPDGVGYVQTVSSDRELAGGSRVDSVPSPPGAIPAGPLTARPRALGSTGAATMSAPTEGDGGVRETPRLGVPRESLEGERRVAITPTVIAQLTKAGLDVVVESGAGEAAGFTDAAYADKGATIGSRDDAFAAQIVAQVRVLGADAESPDLDRLREGQIVIGMSAPFATPQIAAAIAGKGATLFSLELVPRTTRAQAMDVLSSQANVAGYKAVLLAAAALPKMFPLLTTAAGTIAPARVFIMGAGVAGLSAIATARRLGAVVEAYDVRPAVKEEVQSLGARFLELPLDTDQGEGSSGAYAKAVSEETLQKQRELMAKTVAGADVVITTAQVQGAKAPVLVTKEMVAQMTPGSVIVDLAAEQGGNCELSIPGRTVDEGGVLIIGPVNVPSTIPYHASLTYAKNVSNFVVLMVQKGVIDADVDDQIVQESAVTRNGEIVNERVRDALGQSVGQEVAR